MHKEEFIFIVGCPHSGTKFMKRTLSFHSNIAIAPEMHYFSSFIHHGVIKSIKYLYPFDSEHKLVELLKILSGKKLYGSFWSNPQIINFDLLIKKFEKTNRGFADLYALLIKQYSIERSAKFCGEKTPTNLFHVDKLFEWYPNSKVIHIIRDPRSVLSSEIFTKNKPGYLISKKSPFYKIGLFFIVTFVWWRAVNKHNYYKKKYQGRYLLVKFEDLFLHNRNTVNMICNYLDINFEKNMLSPPIKGSSFKQTHDYNPTNSWKKYLPRHYSFLVKFMLSKQLKKLGYI